MSTKKFNSRAFSMLMIAALTLAWIIPVEAASPSAPTTTVLDPAPPAQTVKLIFIHHSTGQNWLADDYGSLGLALSNNNYFVSDTNYGWGPDSIGDRTDIPNWTEWYASASTPTYMNALYNESGQNSSYTRTLTDPGGENQIVMFKSCFPNSALEGIPTDPPSPDGWLTVGHAKYVYNQILSYFGAHPEKLFVVITAPPLQDGTYAANARAFNQWLMNDWLAENGYTAKNVVVFDFYNVLTGPNNHHRYYNSAIEHIFTPGMNTLYYPSGDDHPNEAGSQKATSEFVPLLNIFYHLWQAEVNPAITYVDKDAVGLNNGTSWANAYTNLQTALAAAVSGDEIWVAAGTYKPTAVTDRALTFTPKNGVAIYGGFTGTETSRSQRDPTTNVTVLSGDIDNNDSQTPIITDLTTVTGNETNSYHVVTGTDNAILDGFTITAGNANGATEPAERGAGMYNSSASPTLSNLTFSGNQASYAGGGMWNLNSNPSLTNITFASNSAVFGGGGILNYGSSPTLTNVSLINNSAQGGGGMNNGYGDPILVNVTFSGNSAVWGGAMSNESASPTLTNITFYANNSDYGGAIYSQISSSPVLTNVTFNGNIANNFGGAMENVGGSPEIHNTIFWDNTAPDGAQIYNNASFPILSDSIVQGGCPAGSTCANIIIDDPLLGTLGDYGGYTQTIQLLFGSSAIDAGNDATCADTDQRGIIRPQGIHCDIGAYEAEVIPLPSPWIGSVSITSDKNVVAVGRPHVGAEVASYNGFLEGATTAYLPMLFKNAYGGGSYDSALYIQNLDGLATANVTIKYYKTDGTLTCTDTDTINSLASKGYWLPTLSATECLPAGLPDGWVGGAVVTADKNIVASGRPHVGSEVMTYDSFSEGSLTSYLPMLFRNAYGGSYDAAFYVQNVDDTNIANITIKYYKTDGTLTCTDTDTVAPLASKGYWLPGLLASECLPSGLPDNWVGGVVVFSDVNIVTIGRPHVGTQVTTYNGFSGGGLSSYIPMLFRNAYGGSYDAALYVQNLNPNTTANITVKYYKTDGTLTCTDTDTVAPLASKGYWLPTLSASECLPSLPDDWVGGAVITSDVDIVAIGRPHVGEQVTTYGGFSAGNVNSYLPMLFKDAFGGSYDSAFYIQNTESTVATVVTKFYDNTGALICSRSDTLAGISTLGLWSPNLTCIP
jgi:hypothetical protein